MTPDAYPDDPCLTPPAICDPRIRFFHDDGILFVTAAPPLPGTSPPDSFVAVWRDHADAKPYVFGRRIYTHTDLGHALLRLEINHGVNRAQFTSNSSLLADAVTLALAAPPDATDWPLATHGAIAVALDFDPADISDPSFLLADDDHGGDLDTEDECHNNSFTTGTDGDYEFAPTELLTLDDLAIELTYGTDCCGTSDCCDNNSQCGQNQHCADGECVPDECNGPGDCPEGSHCEGGECVDDSCNGSGECPPGQECIGGQCEKPCNGDGDCPSGNECVGGVCEDCPGVCCDNGDCDDDALCTLDQCRDGGCRHRYKNCTDGDKCTDDYCNPQNGQCEHVANYDDDNPCTLDQCDPETGAATHTCLDDCTTCEDGFCLACACEAAYCNASMSIEPAQVCTNEVFELRLALECYPDCESGFWEISASPETAGVIFIDATAGSIDCTGETVMLYVQAKMPCDRSGTVLFRLDFDSAGEQHCEAAATLGYFRCPDSDMDANRDGVVTDSEADEEGEDVWEYGADKKGAIVLVNCDADGATPPARDLSDNVVNGPNDVADLSELVIRAVPSTNHEGWQRRLRIPGNKAIRVFGALADGAPQIMSPTDTVYMIPDPLSQEFHYGVESIAYPGDRNHTNFTGLVTLYLDLLDDLGVVVCTDTIQLRVAPFIMLPNTAPPHRVLVASDDAGFLNFVQTRAGVPNVIAFHECNSFECDLWPQDAWEFGLSSRPTSGGGAWNLYSGFETLRYNPLKLAQRRPLQPWGRNSLLGGVHAALVDKVGLVFRQAELDITRSYGGNLELIPPYTGHALGRIVVGSMPQVQVAFLNRQEVQGPALQLDTSWLAVGHIDEYMAFVPDPAGFGVVFASPSYAKLILESAPAHEPLFYENSTDPVAQGAVDSADANGLTDNDSDDFRDFVGGYVRIYSGPGKGQIGEIVASGTTEHELQLGKVWRFGSARDVYTAIMDDEPQYRRNNGEWHAGHTPTVDSYYICVPGSKRFFGATPAAGPPGMPFPAVVTASELAADVQLWTAVTPAIEARLTVAWQAVRSALGSHQAPDFLIPMMYLGRTSPSALFEGGAFAYSPGSANMQVWQDQLWVARPFGPRADVSGQRVDLFLQEFETTLNLSGTRTSHFVDDWNTYHRSFGEVHCGTNVIRTAPTAAAFQRWWEVEP